MNKYLKITTISTVLIISIAIIPTLVRSEVSNGGDDVSGYSSENTSGDSSTQGSVSNGGDDVGFSDSSNTGGDTTTSGGVSNGGDDNLPGNTGGESDNNNNGNNSGNTGGVSNGGDDNVNTAPGNNGGNTDTSGSGQNNNGNNNENSGGGGGRSGGHRSVASAVTALPILTNISQCNYLNSYLKIGRANNPVEVTKLQNFLRDIEKIDVDVNGIFDQKTFSAVKTFQAKYVDDVMRPWGVKSPTGQVYFTTRKKINELFCKTTFSLTPAQLAQIEAYRRSRVMNLGTTSSTTDMMDMPADEGDDVGLNATHTSQTASSGTKGNRLWKFIKWLFGVREKAPEGTATTTSTTTSGN